MINTLEHLGPSGSDARWPTATLSRSEEAGVNRAICTSWSWPDLDLLTRSPRSGCQWVSLRVFIDWGAEAFCFESARNRGTDEVRTRRVARKMSARGIRRKKSSLSEVKVAVVGAPSVGKSGTCSGLLLLFKIQCWLCIVLVLANFENVYFFNFDSIFVKNRNGLIEVIHRRAFLVILVYIKIIVNA